MRFSPKRVAGVLVVAGAMSVATFAFTASNNVEPSTAGSGSGVISGYDITEVSYNLNAADPTTIDSVTFSMDVAPVAGSTVTIRLADTSATWFTCTMSGTPATSASCPANGALVADATNLTVVAAN